MLLRQVKRYILTHGAPLDSNKRQQENKNSGAIGARAHRATRTHARIANLGDFLGVLGEQRTQLRVENRAVRLAAEKIEHDSAQTGAQPA